MDMENPDMMGMGDEAKMEEEKKEDGLGMPAMPIGAPSLDFNKSTEGTFVSVDYKENLEPCCCCLCTCSTDQT